MDNLGSEDHLIAWYHLGPDSCGANPDPWSTRTIAAPYGTAPHSDSAVMERGSLLAYAENGIPCVVCAAGNTAHFQNLIGKDTSLRGLIC